MVLIRKCHLPDKNTKKSSLYLVLILGSIAMLIPFYWMIITSFKTEADILAYPIVWFPSEFTGDNFKRALDVVLMLDLWGNVFIAV